MEWAHKYKDGTVPAVTLMHVTHVLLDMATHLWKILIRVMFNTVISFYQIRLNEKPGKRL